MNRYLENRIDELMRKNINDLRNLVKYNAELLTRCEERGAVAMYDFRTGIKESQDTHAGLLFLNSLLRTGSYFKKCEDFFDAVREFLAEPERKGRVREVGAACLNALEEYVRNDPVRLELENEQKGR